MRYAGITAPFVRLKVLLDANLDGVPEASATSQVQGWTNHVFETGSKTFSMPLLKAEVYAGTAGAATGENFVAGQTYYAEVIAGDREGQRFEIDEAKSSATAIAYEGTGPAKVDRIVVRAHWTLNELFPVTMFHATNSTATSDRVMFFNGISYEVYWLMARTSGSRWVRDGDASLSDAGARIVGPFDGLMVNVRGAAVTLPYTGAVRSWGSRVALHSGAQLTGSGYPLSLSPAARSMTAAAGFASTDAFRLWLGDTSAAAAYSSFTLQAGKWTAEDGHDATASPVFDAYRAAWLISTQGNANWAAPAPWSAAK